MHTYFPQHDYNNNRTNINNSGCYIPIYEENYPLATAFLGITFNWGVIMGWTSVSESLSPVIFMIYLSCIFWTLGYDTVYGYQDIVDDKIIGIKSTAVLFEKNPKTAIYTFYIISFLLMFMAMIWIGSDYKTFLVFLCAVMLGIVLLGKLNLREVQSCASFFLANKYIGFLAVLALALSI